MEGAGSGGQGERLELRLLGGLDVRRGGRAVTGFRSSKAAALLAFLAVTGRPQTRGHLATLLWGEAPEASARASLRNALANLNALAGAHLSVDRHNVAFVAGGAWVDVAAFEAHLSPPAPGASSPAATLEAAVTLYGGDLLAGVDPPDAPAFDEWLAGERARLRGRALGALYALAVAHRAAGETEGSLGALRRLLALEPWQEEAHRRLMVALAGAGRRAEALAQYARCRALLADELGVEPEVETRALYERLRAGQACDPDALPESMAPAGGAAPPHNLPPALTPFVGREAELAALAALRAAGGARLLTLVGAGGMGKTRLALEAARAALGTFPDGVFMVPLAPLADAASLGPAVAAALDLPVRGGDAAATLHRFLRDRRLLLLLDNFEHLLAGAPMVAALLEGAPRLEVIVTSRQPLNLRAEQVYAVEGLDYDVRGPAADDGAAASPAVRLFAQSARRARAGFRLEAEDLPAVLRICRLVGGMPLGLELAAGWSGALTPAELAAEIERNADVLAADWPDAPARQRSLRAVFDWSWALLDADERAVLARLAVFRGGFTREAAGVVAGASLRVLGGLVRKSLLRRAAAGQGPGGDAGGGGRYELHELLRQFAAERLGAEEGATVAGRHADRYLAYVAARGARLARDAPLEAAAEIGREIDNVRQAWVWATAHGRTAALGGSAYPLWQYYLCTGQTEEAERAFALAAERVQAHRETAGGHEPAAGEGQEGQLSLSKLLALHAFALGARRRHDEAMAVAQRALALAPPGRPTAGAPAAARTEAAALGQMALGMALFRKGRHQVAAAAFEEAARLAQVAAGVDAAPVPASLTDLSWQVHVWLRGVGLCLSDFDRARYHGEQALRVCRTQRLRLGEVLCLCNLANVEREVRDYPAARSLYQQALGLAPLIRYPWAEGTIRAELGDVVRLQGEYSLARELLGRALAIHRQIGSHVGEAYAVASLGRLHSLLGDHAGAWRWLDQFRSVVDADDSPGVRLVGLLPLAAVALRTSDFAQAVAYAAEALRTVRAFSNRYNQADALVLLGHAQAGLRRLPEAAASYGEALTLYGEAGNAPLAAEPRAGLAAVALARGEREQALALVAEVIDVLRDHPRAGLDEPFTVYLTCYRVLSACRDPRAAGLLRAAGGLLQAYAGAIAEPDLRRSFLRDVPAHRELQLPLRRDRARRRPRRAGRPAPAAG